MDNNIYKYVCQFPEEIEKSILKDAKKELKKSAYEIDLVEELENIRNSRLCDLSELIDIKIYV